MAAAAAATAKAAGAGADDPDSPGLPEESSAAAAVSVLGYGLILMAFESAEAGYVVAVRQTSVLFAAVLAVPLLGERPTFRRALGALSTVVGVGLIALWG